MSPNIRRTLNRPFIRGRWIIQTIYGENAAMTKILRINFKMEPKKEKTKHDQNIFAISIVNDLSFCKFVILSIIEGKK